MSSVVDRDVDTSFAAMGLYSFDVCGLLTEIEGR